MKRRDLIAGTVGLAGVVTSASCAYAQLVRRRIAYVGTAAGGGYIDLQLRIGRESLDHVLWSMPFRQGEWSALIAAMRGRTYAVVVANVAGQIIELQKAAPETPLVFIIADDPIAAGLANSLAAPGKNATGYYLQSDELMGKCLELLRECRPSMRRVAMLHRTRLPPAVSGPMHRTFEAHARKANLASVFLEYPDLEGVEAAIAKWFGAEDVGLYVVGDTLSSNPDVSRRIAEVALRARIPTVAEGAFAVRNGFLLGYSADLSQTIAILTDQIERILAGAKAGDLPIVQPTGFLLSVNLKTAAALGLTVPATVIARATEVIE